MKKLSTEFSQKLQDINIIPGKCSECPFFMSRTHFNAYVYKETEYICILTEDHIDEDVFYYENIKYANCPIKEVHNDYGMTDKQKEVVQAMADESKDDSINPNHYKSETSLECIEAMLIVFGNDIVIAFCLCNAWKYIWRWKNKNGIEDLKKAEWYIEKGRELLGNDLDLTFGSTNIHQRFDSMADYINLDHLKHFQVETESNEDTNDGVDNSMADYINLKTELREAKEKK